MVKLLTDPEKLAKPDISMFQSKDNGGTAQAIAGVTQAGAAIAGQVFQRQDQVALAGVSDQMSSLFQESATASQQVMDGDLSPEELASLDATQARLHKLRMVDKQRGVTAQNSSRLIAFQRQAVAANPRLRGEIEQMFAQQTGTTAGRLSQDLIDDPLGNAMRDFAFQTSDPDLVKNNEQQLEQDVRKWYSSMYGDHRVAPYHEQESAYQKYNAATAAAAAAAAQAKLQKLNGENSDLAGARAAAAHFGANLQPLINYAANLPNEMKGKTPEEISVLQTNWIKTIDSLSGAALPLLGLGSTKTANMYIGVYNNLKQTGVDYLNGKLTKDQVQNALDINMASNKLELNNIKGPDGQSLGQLLLLSQSAGEIGTLMENITNPKIKKYLGDNIQASLVFTQMRMPGADLFRDTGIAPKDGFSSVMTAVNSMLNNKPDEQATANIRNAFSNLYDMGNMPLEDRPQEEQLVIMKSAVDALKNPKMAEFLIKEPQIGNIMQETADKYAHQYALGINKTIDSALTGSLTRDLPVDLNRHMKGLDLSLNKIISPQISASETIYFQNKFKSPEEVIRMLTKHATTIGIGSNPRAGILDRTPSEAELDTAGRRLFSTLNTLSNDLTNKYSLAIRDLSKARMNMTGDPSFIDAANHVLSITDTSGTYLFQPYQPPVKGSETQ